LLSHLSWYNNVNIEVALTFKNILKIYHLLVLEPGLASFNSPIYVNTASWNSRDPNKIILRKSQDDLIL